MLFHARAAAPPLRDLVDILWFAESNAMPHPKERLLPTGTMELIVNLLEDVVYVYDRRDLRMEILPGAIVVGAASEFMVIDTRNETCVLGVHFRPGGALPLLGELPAGEVRDQHVALAELWGAREANDLRVQLLAAPSTQEKFDVVERVLTARLTRSRERQAAVAHILQRIPRTRTITEATRDVGWSQRRLIDAFSNEVGLTPKVYGRVMRFQRVLRRVHAHAQDDVDWADIALACGYFDQSHLVRDFRAIAGITPTDYLMRRTPHQNHVPME
ncbi:MAG: AraC family transcriptional regulator [Acidobacteria bacterium]|nr:MAG: AraC family transcriptional regulator [Acidobacteriota bacterium]